MMKMYARWREKYLQNPDAALTVAHIPARLASSRIPRKNLRELRGLPLIAYSILMARAIPEIDMVCVNTESPELAELAKAYGAEVPVERPASLAGNDSLLGDASQFFYDWLRDSPLVVGKVVTLYPTHIFRNRERVREMVRSLDDYVFVHSAMQGRLSWKEMLVSDGGELKPALRSGPLPELPDSMLKLTGSFLGHSCTGPWARETFEKVFLHVNPFEAIDIDTMNDWELSEQVLDLGLFDFGVDFHALLD